MKPGLSEMLNSKTENRISMERELCSASCQVSRHQRERKLSDSLNTKNSVVEGNQSQIFRTVLIIALISTFDNELTIVS